MIDEEVKKQSHRAIFKKLRSQGYSVLTNKKRINHFTAVVVRPDTLQSVSVQLKDSSTNSFIVGDGYDEFMADKRFDNLIYILTKSHPDGTYDTYIVPGKVAKKIRAKAWRIHPRNNPGSEYQKKEHRCRQTITIKEIARYKDKYENLWE